jgi:PKD repeat protein
MDDITFTPPGAPATRTPWEMHHGEGIVEWGVESPQHGAPMEYDYATIPSADDPGWSAAPDPEVINYQQVPSTLCDVCDCRYGGEFTYFRTYVDIPADAWLTGFRIVTSGVDDGIRVSIYNSEHPDGLVVPGSYVYHGGSGTADLQDYVVRGEVNTILITHVDDCCYHSFLLTAEIVLSGLVVPTPPATVPPTADAGGPYTGDEGAPVTLDGGGSADPDGSIVSFNWDFGDGTTGSGPTPEHAFADDGVYTVTLTVTDDDGQSSSASTTATIANVAPALSVDLSSVAVSEGELAENAGTVSDPGDDQVTLTASVGEITRADGAWSWSFSATDGPAQSQTVTLTAADDDGGISETSFDLAVANVAPTVGAISAPRDPVSVGTSITASAAFTDPGTLDTHTAEWSWDWPAGTPEAGTVTQGGGSGSVTDGHAYNEAGLYRIQLAVTDNDGDSGLSPVFEYVVVYDPTAGFVSGGGWIASPAGAYKPEPSLSGKANFGFVAKYKKGTEVPTGQAEFQFHVAGLDFHSTSYEWLVVTGTGSDYARFKGSGTINGAGDYKFMIWASDKDADTFRIRIWEEDEATGVETEVYDNGFDQEIGGGSIVIHAQ